MQVGQSTPSSGETGHPDAPLVTVRYWAAARHAAGVAEEKHRGGTVAEVLDAARDAHRDSPRFAPVLTVCSVLLGEQPLGSQDLTAVAVASGDVIEVLPPFAGG
jgi:molybdopterin converting factor small subunit